MSDASPTPPTPPTPPLRPMFLAAAVVCLVAIVASFWPDHRTHAGPASGTSYQQPPGFEPMRPQAGDVLRVGTFNIHAGRGPDGVRDTGRSLAAIEQVSPLHLLALQEVDHGEGRRPDQAMTLATPLTLAWLSSPRELLGNRPSIGNALLTRLPISHWLRVPLNKTLPDGYRHLLLVQLETADKPINVIVAHTDGSEDQDAQLRAVAHLLLSLQPPVLLMGDLNTRPDHPVMVELLSHDGVTDLLTGLDDERRIDWLLARGLTRRDAGKVDNGASDHPLYWAEVVISP